jgi:hypothetical protein
MVSTRVAYLLTTSLEEHHRILVGGQDPSASRKRLVGYERRYGGAHCWAPAFGAHSNNRESGF